MIAPTHIPQLPAGAPEVLRCLAWAFAGLFEAIGRAFNGNARAPVPGLVVYQYLRRTRRTRDRLMRLLENLRAGVLPRARSAGGTPREAGERKVPRLVLPRGKGWLAREIGWFGRSFAEGLQSTLNSPETAGLIAGSPQAQRLLRPLVRMLGLQVPAVAALPARPRKVRARPERARRLTRKAREANLWYPNLEGVPMKLLPRRLPRD